MFLFILSSGCAGAAAIEERAASPVAHRAAIVERVALPAGSKAAAAWVGALGDGYVALNDGRIVAIEPRGALHFVDRFPGEAARSGDAPPIAIADRLGDAPLVLVPDGALAIDRGMLRRAPLPDFLRMPRAFAPCGSEALWATDTGLFASRAGAWIKLDARDASEVVPIGDGAWVRAGGSLKRLRIDANGATWLEATPGVDVGAVRSIARVDASRGIVAGDRGVAVVGPDRIRAFHGASDDGAPDVVGGGGGWGWIGWAGQILRTDGESLESIVGGVALGSSARIAVDGQLGDLALVVDGAGGVIRIVADDRARTSGLRDGDTVVDPKIDLEAIAPIRADLRRVTFAVDGRAVAERTQAPWGWGSDGARARDLTPLAFGRHVVTVSAEDSRATRSVRTIAFTYASPFGRVPTFAADVVPIVAARCARCHAGGVAHELSSYAQIAAESSMVRAAIRERRMPPDILLDPTSTAILTAWVDGGTPR